MSILSGFEKIKRYNKKSNGYKLLSHWTSSDTVELSSNGQTLTTAWANKADLVNGTVPIAQLPKVVFDEMVKVADDTARFALTTSQVQNGDTVYIIATSLMYLVIDDTKLNQEAGYQGYSAAVDWDTIDGRPDNITYWVDDDEEETGASISPVLRQNSLKTNLTTTVAGSPLDATMGKELQDEIDDIEGDISTINSNLTELDAYVKGNTLNAFVKITSYTSASPYTCPKDGFIMVVSASTLGALTSVFNPINQYVPFARTEPVRAGYPQTISIFVKKGMQFYVSKSTGTDGEVYFCGID